MRMSVVVIAVLALVPTSALADLRGAGSGSPFRYVYPASASREAVAKLYRDDLAALRDETASLGRVDGGLLTDDHRTYLAMREKAIARRYAEATAAQN